MMDSPSRTLNWASASSRRLGRSEDLDLSSRRAATVFVSELPSRVANMITWAQAAWNGKTVNVDCRCEAKGELTGEINSGGEWTPITDFATDPDRQLRSARVRWEDSKRPPSIVQLKCENETVRVPVFDERPLQERRTPYLPRVDKKPGPDDGRRVAVRNNTAVGFAATLRAKRDN